MKVYVSIDPFSSTLRIDEETPYTNSEIHVLYLIATNPAVVATASRCLPPPGDYTMILDGNVLLVTLNNIPLFEAELTRKNSVAITLFKNGIDDETARCILASITRHTLASIGRFRVIMGDG